MTGLGYKLGLEIEVKRLVEDYRRTELMFWGPSSSGEVRDAIAALAQALVQPQLETVWGMWTEERLALHRRSEGSNGGLHLMDEEKVGTGVIQNTSSAESEPIAERRRSLERWKRQKKPRETVNDE